MKERKKLLQKNKICMKGKFILKTKEKFILCFFLGFFLFFWIRGNLILWVSRSKIRSFLKLEVCRKMIFPYWSLLYLKLAWYSKNREKLSFSSYKNGKIIFSLAWKTMFTGYWKFLFWNLRRWEAWYFFEPKKVMEWRYLFSVFELFMIFQGLENMFFVQC